MFIAAIVLIGGLSALAGVIFGTPHWRNRAKSAEAKVDKAVQRIDSLSGDLAEQEKLVIKLQTEFEKLIAAQEELKQINDKETAFLDQYIKVLESRQELAEANAAVKRNNIHLGSLDPLQKAELIQLVDKIKQKQQLTRNELERLSLLGGETVQDYVKSELQKLNAQGDDSN